MANRTRVVVRTPGWILAGMLSLLAGLGPIAPASAQPTPSAGDARQRADELFRQGKEHFKEKKYAQTREAYQAAFDLKKSYDIACNLGNVEILLGKTRDGVEHLSFCIANFAATGDAALLEKAKKVIGDAKKQVAELTIRVNVKDAVVSVDGREIGRAPLAGAIFVEPGSRNVEAQLTGYEPARLVVGAGKGSAQTVEITLTASKVQSAADANTDHVVDADSACSSSRPQRHRRVEPWGAGGGPPCPPSQRRPEERPPDRRGVCARRGRVWDGDRVHGGRRRRAIGRREPAWQDSCSGAGGLPCEPCGGNALRRPRRCAFDERHLQRHERRWVRRGRRGPCRDGRLPAASVLRRPIARHRIHRRWNQGGTRVRWLHGWAHDPPSLLIPYLSRTTMRTNHSMFVTLGLLAIAVGVHSTGCFDSAGDCEENLQSPCYPGPTGGSGGSGGGTPVGCVPSENADPVGDECGVFVGGAAAKDDNAGTKGAPVATLARAITLAGEKSGRVYACMEEFAETIEVPAGIEIYGGLDCAADWKHVEGQKTTIAPEADLVPVTLLGGAGARLEDVAATAAGATTPGGSSIAVIAQDGATAELLRCELRAGSGAPGAAGITPMEVGPNGEGQNGENGMPGINSMPACMSTMGLLGGNGGQRMCDRMSVSGGLGGAGTTTDTGGPGGNGQPQPGPMPLDGKGGKEQDAAQCTVGNAGAEGSPGMSGSGATGIGDVSPGGYTAANASSGMTVGAPGQGGGGGGGAKTCDAAMLLPDLAEEAAAQAAAAVLPDWAAARAARASGC